MCIILFDNRDSTDYLGKSVLKRCREKNQDGMGIMWANEGKLKSWRTMKDLTGLYQRYVAARKLKLPVAIHFRLGTKGDALIKNVHPFRIKANFSFMHNGTITDLTAHLPDGISDTSYINTEMFQQLPNGFLQSPPQRIAIRLLLGGDRMIFMDGKGNYTIINEDRMGAKWKDGIWWSKGYELEYLLTGQTYTAPVTTPINQGGLIGYDYDEHEGWWPNQAPKSSVTKITDILLKNQEDRPRESKKSKKILVRDIGGRERSQTSPAVTGPIPSTGANLVFDYGFLSRSGYSDSRFSDRGGAILPDHQLWAIGDGSPNDQPVVYGCQGSAVIGKVYEIDHHFHSVLTNLDTRHGCDTKAPESSVYFRRYLPIIMGEAKKKDWAWVYRYAIPLSQITKLASVVPFGDWTRWVGDNIPENEVGTLCIDKLDLTKTYQCPLCTGKNTVPTLMWEDKTDYVLHCFTCDNDSVIYETEVS